ncbi:MAG: beta-galactosidase, partial [Clostridia bacterium]|nr:beta-galactosidase [Deltaproteobacteria bacterium]
MSSSITPVDYCDDGAGAPSAASTGSNASGARIVRGELLINGTPTFLYGGELQYFRVRDAGGDVAKTHAMWAATLDAMVEANMNLVTTYVPWDFHARADRQCDFTGTRDLSLFLSMVAARGMKAIVKPGPLIFAEWPRDFGSYGAVPQWWKQAHLEALEQTPDGKLFAFANFGPGKPSNRQPTLLHPAYLSAVADFYGQFAAAIKDHLGSTVIGVQVDNETNNFWASPFGGPGYSAVVLAHYRQYLRSRYASIEAVNDAYGTAHTTFDEVNPPTRDPKWSDSAKDNPWLRDWYDAGQL